MANAGFQVEIQMSAATVTAMVNSGFYLYGFKAVQSSDLAGRPLVWLRMQSYFTITSINWAEQYEAYISTSPLSTNEQISVGSSAAIALGQTWQIQSGGVGTVTSGGPSTAISILNTTDTELTCGVSETLNGAASPLCAFPLYGNTLDVISPIEKILLMFCTSLIEAGTVVGQSGSSDSSASYVFGAPGSLSSGILIELTAANQRCVSFDSNEGWSWGEYSWAQQVLPTSDLVSLLIEAPGT